MKRTEKESAVVLYLCDRRACDGGCLNEDCSHTSDIRHAKNFESVSIKEGLVDYFEMEPVMA